MYFVTTKMLNFFDFSKRIFVYLIWIPTVLCQIKDNEEGFNCKDIQVLNEQNFVKEVVILNMLEDKSFDIDCIYKKYSEKWQVILLDSEAKMSKSDGKRYYNLMMKKYISFAVILPKPDTNIIRNSHLFPLLRRVPKAIVEIYFFNLTSSTDYLREFEKFANNLLFDLEIIHFVGIVLSDEKLYFMYDVNSNDTDAHINIVTSTNNFNYTDIVTNSYKLRKKLQLIITIFQRFPSCLIEAQNDTKLNILVGSHGFAGKDSLIIDVLVQALGVQPIYSIPPGVEPFGSVMENGTVTGTLKEIVDGTVDVSANPRFITSYGVDDDIVFLGYNHIDNVCIIIPKAEIVPLWVQVVKTYTLRIWALIFLQTITITLLRWLHSKMKERSMSPIDLFIDTACSYIVPVSSLRNSQQKLVLCSISLICIIVVPVIQGSIRSVFTSRKYYPDLNTLEDVEKNYKVLYAPAMDRKLIFEKGYNKIYDSLYDKMDNSPIFLNELIDITLANRGTGIITPLTDFKSALFDHPLELADRFHIVQECPREYLYASICSVHFPFKEELTMLTLRLVASGLPVWYHEFTMAILSSRSFVNAPSPTSMATRPLEIQHMDGPFFLLGVGVLISIVVFVFEVCYGKPSLKKNE